MKFDPIKCPNCGENARGTLEDIVGVAEFAYDDDGKLLDYSGSTEVFWDDQTTRSGQNGGGSVVLICHEGHEWEATKTDDEADTETGDGKKEEA